jgi:hypothetical protein
MNLWGLLGLLSLPLIVLLHLFRERERRHTVSSLELWAWLRPEVRGPRPRRIPWNRILVLQLLAAFCLTAALVNPQLPLPAPPLQAGRLILIVDTSSSMSATDVAPSRLAEAQARAAARLVGLGSDDSAVLIAVGNPAWRVSDSAQVGLGALARNLAGLRAAGVGHDWPGALALAAASIVPGQDNRLLVFTDGAFDLPSSLNTTLPAPVEWNLIGSPQPNQAIITLAARPAASGAQQVFARVANFGPAPAERVITLLADGETVDSSRLALGASGTAALAWTLPPGARTVEVRLADADALPADDRAALGLSNPPLEALLVSPASADAADRCAPGETNRAPVERALCAMPNLQLKTLGPESYVAFEPHDLYVFQGWLPEAWPQGGVLVLDPPTDSALLPLAEAEPITQTLMTDPLLTDVSFSGVTFGRALGLSAPAPALPFTDQTTARGPSWLSPVYAEDNNGGLIWRGSQGSTRAVVLSFILGESNLAKRNAFPILIANAARELLPPPLPESIRPGDPVALPSEQVFLSLSLTDPQGRVQTIGAQRGALFDDTTRTGLYVLEGLTRDGQLKTVGFGVNAGSWDESDLGRRAEPQFSVAAIDAPSPLTNRLPLADLWPVLVVAVVVLLLTEARLAWR